MAEAIVSPIVEKLKDYAVAAIFGQFEYLFYYNRNIQNLGTKVRDLENRRNDVQDSVDEAKRNALIIKLEVDAWLKKVDDLKKEADEVLTSSTNSEMQCLCLGCPNLMTRRSLSSNATKKITAIDELLKVKFEEVGKRAPLKLLSYHGSEDLKTRISTKEKIIKALKDTAISIVGICGLPGVGKTTMATDVMTQVLKDKLFDEVAMAVVSQDVDIIRIQEKLAEVLNLKIEEKTNEVARASRLNERLTYDKKKRILVILDDVWTGIDLEKLGIPSLSHREGLKILLTSRFEQVCKGMGALTKIKVEALDSDEAFAFFENISKISNNDTSLLDIAKQVAEECKGLPLALEVVGKTLINSERHAWEDALNELRNSQLDDKVYSSIEWSYNYLKSDEHRKLLLLCSLFPEDESIPIEILVRYARGLELFKNTKTLLQTRNRAHTIFDDLKSCHLLLRGFWEEQVKLHDVIRDFCLSIASKGEDFYPLKHDLVTEWPELNAHKSYSAISLTFQKAIRLPSRLRCGNLKLLRMQCRPQNIEFVLDDTQELRVIDLSGLRILSPTQLSEGLRTLCLDRCDLRIRMSFFGSLKNLEILTFYESSLSHDFFSGEVVELSNLKLLDLRFSDGPRPLPRGFLLGMKKLEELYLGDYFHIRYKEKEHIIEEVSSLKALNHLQISTNDTQFLMQLLQGCSEKLETFQISQSRYFSIGQPSRRYLSLENIDPNMLSRIKSLMGKSEQLNLSVEGWNNPVIELAENGFINLKSLTLIRLDSEYLIDAAGSIPSDTFRNLETLYLIKMRRLKEMCNANFPRMEHVTRGVSEGLFRNLMFIYATDCDKMKRMFSQSVAKCMVNLEKLYIRSCPLLEEVVSVDTQENEIPEPPLFPKLKVVELDDLKSFVSFGSQPNAVGLRQTLLNQVTLPNMEKLTLKGLGSIEKILSMEETPSESLSRLRVMTVENCDKLVNIAQSNSIKLLNNLQDLQVVGGEALNVIFDFEGLSVNKDNEEEISILGQLKSLELRNRDNVVHIATMVPKGIHVFQNLKRLEISRCGRLKYLFPASMINSFVCLETLSVESCDEIEEIFGREEEEEEEMASNIEFRELWSIKLIGLPRFKMFCSGQLNAIGLRQTLLNQVTLPNMEKLTLEGLGSIEKILSMEETPSESLSRLRVMKVENCDKLVNIAQSNSIKLLNNLQDLQVVGGEALNVIFDFEGLSVNKDSEEEISILGQLKSLKLRGGYYLMHITRMVPKGIHVFQNLKELEVENCGRLKYLFPASMINSFVCLETLSVESCGEIEEIFGREEEEEEMASNIEFRELRSIKLIGLPRFKMFCSGQLNAIGLRQTLLNQVTLPHMERLYLYNLDSIEKILSMEETPSESLSRLRVMKVENCDKLVNIAQSNSIKLLKNLEVLEVAGREALNVIFDFEGLSVNKDNEEEISILGQLKSLELRNGDNVVHITTMVPKGIHVFQNLKRLEISRCGRLKYLFPASMINSFVCLETLSVESCGEIEEIFGREEEEEEMASNIEFRELRSIKLIGLPRFKMFCSGQLNAIGLRQTLLNQVTLPHMERLYLYNLDSIEKILSMEETPSESLSRLRVMKVENCDKLVNIAQSNSIKLLKNLEVLEVAGREALNVIFDFEGLSVNKDNEEEISILGQLKSLELRNGDNVVHIMTMVPKGIHVFQNLKRLEISRCGRLKYLFPASMINSFVCLETLSVKSCDEIEEIFGREEEEEGMASNIVFPELRSIYLIRLPRFKMFCSHDYELAFPSLDLLRIKDCPVMTKFCSGQLNAPKLKEVHIENNEIIDISNFPNCDAVSVHNSPSSTDCE